MAASQSGRPSRFDYSQCWINANKAPLRGVLYGLAQFFRRVAQSQKPPDRLSDFHSARAPFGDASPSKDISSWLAERRDLSARQWVADKAPHLNHDCRHYRRLRMVDPA